MRKLKLYLETSVWNFLFADDAPEKRLFTEYLFENIDNGLFDIYISRTVIAEIEEAPDHIRNELLKPKLSDSPHAAWT